MSLPLKEVIIELKRKSKVSDIARILQASVLLEMAASFADKNYWKIWNYTI